MLRRKKGLQGNLKALILLSRMFFALKSNPPGCPDIVAFFAKQAVYGFRENATQAAPKRKAAGFGSDLRLVILNEAARREGTKAAERFADMLALLKKEPNVKLSEIFERTIYSRGDFQWDLDHGSVKTEKWEKA